MAYKKNYKDLNFMQECVLRFIPTEPTGVHSKDIARYTGENERDIRYIIQTLRDNGIPICATPKDGYWIARTSNDLNETIKKMESHIQNCKDTLQSLLDIKAEIERSENGD